MKVLSKVPNFQYNYTDELQQLVSLNSGEEKLYYAIFERSFLDIVNNDGKNSEKRRNKRNAKKWFYSKDFLIIVENFSPNPEAFVKKVFQALTKHDPYF